MEKKLMVVDDEPDVALSVETGLYTLTDEYKVIGVNSGKECFEFLENNEIPDLILLDIMMPEMNGWDVAAKIKAHPSWKEIPIVFLTAKTDPHSKGFGKIASEDYIEKPFEINDLKKRIDLLLAGRET